MLRAVVRPMRRAFRRLGRRGLLFIDLAVRLLQRTVTPRLAHRLLSRHEQGPAGYYRRFALLSATANRCRLSSRSIPAVVARPSWHLLALITPPRVGDGLACFAQLFVLAMRRPIRRRA